MISLIQTAEGALNETHDILQRMRELQFKPLMIQINTADRKAIQKELESIKLKKLT